VSSDVKLLLSIQLIVHLYFEQIITFVFWTEKRFEIIGIYEQTHTVSRGATKLKAV